MSYELRLFLCQALNMRDKESDEELENLLQTSSHALLKKIKLSNSNPELLCDRSTSVIHPFVTQKFRKDIFDIIHNFTHPSSIKMITKRFTWPPMKADIAK